MHFSQLFVCSGDFYRDFYVFSSFTLQKSVLLRTFAKKKRSFFRSLKIFFLPDAIKKTRFPMHDHPIYIRFFFRFIVFWYLYLCPGDFAGVFAGFRRFSGTYFCYFGTFFHNSGARVIFQPFPAVFERKETGRFKASAIMMIFAVWFFSGVFHDKNPRLCNGNILH